MKFFHLTIGLIGLILLSCIKIEVIAQNQENQETQSTTNKPETATESKKNHESTTEITKSSEVTTEQPKIKENGTQSSNKSGENSENSEVLTKNNESGIQSIKKGKKEIDINQEHEDSTRPSTHVKVIVNLGDKNGSEKKPSQSQGNRRNINNRIQGMQNPHTVVYVQYPQNQRRGPQLQNNVRYQNQHGQNQGPIRPHNREYVQQYPQNQRYGPQIQNNVRYQNQRGQNQGPIGPYSRGNGQQRPQNQGPRQGPNNQRFGTQPYYNSLRNRT
ncbi:uncharacterized protein LOC122500852 [Leptopilina heterotoma]|uniref:uncharacterized protein LOC122500852 n=1 Tax=Leptopilina heterotoma TaxID=63436 RepID=UPI001CA9683E|nr:uncharacterized protein LOC122500852 [Leptopilina heterotoma]XP_043465915.1 uncharacterized protein LOC122500852 [Leptopilina heterotoma]